jgi:hypothetical protein
MKKSTLSLLGIGAAFASFELLYRRREKKPCLMLPAHRHPWRIHNYSDENRVYKTNIPIRNFNPKYESTIVDVRASVRLLSKDAAVKGVSVEATVKPWHSDTREDGYWPAYILTPQTTLEFELSVSFSGDLSQIDDLHAVVIDLDYVVYDRQEKLTKHEEVVLIPETDLEFAPEGIAEGDTTIFPIKTHILSDADHMSEIVAKYAEPHAESDDIVVMAESVVAVTQRRYLVPDEHVKPGYWAKRLCYLVPNAGSLSSPYGMQCAIDEVGLPRMLAAFGIGAGMKALGRPGWMYTIAGLPSELIDDITGTMAPFDKYIVLGPSHAQSVVNEVKARTGLNAAISDVNDLKRARILAATSDVDQKRLQQSLLSNPMGNAKEQTPIVLIRYADSKVESPTS